MDYIVLIPRGDRLGNNLIGYISQFCYAHKNNCKVIVNTDIAYSDSIFVKYLLFAIEHYNNKLSLDTEPGNNHNIIIYHPWGLGGYDMCATIGNVVCNIESDIFSYFKTHLCTNTSKLLDTYYLNANYSVPFDVNKSIVIHLRLDDQWCESDYDGSVCSSHFINLINENNTCTFTNVEGNKYNKQNPLSGEKINTELQKLKEKYPSYEVVVVASPLSKIPDMGIHFDKIIQSEDYNYDLFLLSKAKHIILSRSMFSLVALFFGEHIDIVMPLWGHFACSGFGTKYDKCNFTYFY
jgi:hypothetical protein